MKSVFTGSICVVGKGRWGTSLLSALRAREIPCFAADPRRPVKAPRWADAEVFWLCVPDEQISTATRRIVRTIASRERAGQAMRGRVVLHSSGVYGSEILKDAFAAGAAVASVHPLMSFPTRKPVALAAVPFAVESSGRLKSKLFRLVSELGGQPFTIRAEGKALYHAAAVMASPLLASLAAAAVAAARAGGLPEKEANTLLQPIMMATLANFFGRGAASSFSGPFARGDAKTVSLHLAALASHPEMDCLYRSLAMHALDVFPVKHRNQLKRVLTPAPSKTGPQSSRRRRV